MKLFLATGLFCLLAFGVPAQTNFKPGYVVLNSDDTVRGEIDFGNWAVNPELITFRNGGTSQKYGTGLLKAFGVDNETKFRRFRISYQRSAAELGEAQESFDGPVETKDAWLRLLYDAKYALYELSTPKRKHFFIASDKTGIKELIYRVRLTTTGEMEKDEQYKNLLAVYAMEEGNEAAVQKKLATANYDDNSLLKIFELLNKGEARFKESVQTKTKFDISAGGTLYNFTTSGKLYNDGSGAYAVYTADFKSSVGFTAGLGLTYYSKKNRGRIQSRLGLNFGILSLDGENTSGEGSFQKENYKGSLMILEPNASIDWLLSRDKQPNILMGIVAGYNVVVGNNFSSTFENPGIVVNKDNYPPTNGGFLTAGINGTVTGDWGRLNLRLYTFSNIFDSPFTTLKGTGISLTYGYFLKK